jgi:hypothetical protein
LPTCQPHHLNHPVDYANFNFYHATPQRGDEAGKFAGPKDPQVARQPLTGLYCRGGSGRAGGNGGTSSMLPPFARHLLK